MFDSTTENNKPLPTSYFDAKPEETPVKFTLPLGYKFEYKNNGERKVVKDPPVAKVIQHILKSFDKGYFAIPEQVADYMNQNKYSFALCPKGYATTEDALAILENPFYAGIKKVVSKLSLVMGKHPALITVNTYRDIQRRLKADKCPTCHGML